MVAVPMLSQSEFGRNDQLEDALHCKSIQNTEQIKNSRFWSGEIVYGRFGQIGHTAMSWNELKRLSYLYRDDSSKLWKTIFDNF